MRRALLALLTAALLTTAGWSGAFGGAPAGSTVTTETTAKTPTDEAPDTTPTANDRFPPGLTADGLADPDALVNAHADAVEDESLTLEERQVREYGDSDRGWTRNRTLRTATNRTRFVLRTVTDDKPVYGATEGRVTTFADGKHVYRKVETPNTSWSSVLRTATGDPEDPRDLVLDAARTDDLYVLLNAFALNESESVQLRADDPGRYRLESTTLARPGLLASHLDLATVRNASLRAVVTGEGQIVTYRLEFVGTKRGQVVRGTTTVEYSAVGETEIQTPPWSSELRERIEEETTSEYGRRY